MVTGLEAASVDRTDSSSVSATPATGAQQTGDHPARGGMRLVSRDASPSASTGRIRTARRADRRAAAHAATVVGQQCGEQRERAHHQREVQPASRPSATNLDLSQNPRPTPIAEPRTPATRPISTASPPSIARI